MKYIILFTLLFFDFSNDSDMCSPVRPLASEMVELRDDYVFVKGYFIEHDGSKVHLARFKVTHTTDANYVVDKTYPVYEYGPFGSECEVYELGASPLDDALCGAENPRYIILYKNIGDCERLVTPIFHAGGMVIAAQNNEIIDEYHERTKLTDFENYIYKESNTAPKWVKSGR